MLCIFKGAPKTRGRDEVRALITQQIAPTEADPTVNHGVDGCYKEFFRTSRIREGGAYQGKHYITPELAALALRDSNLADLLFGKEREMRHFDRDELLPEARKVMISPSLTITLAAFPHGWRFGNGVTFNRRIGGLPEIVSWCVFPASADAVVAAKFEQLRQLMEE